MSTYPWPLESYVQFVNGHVHLLDQLAVARLQWEAAAQYDIAKCRRQHE